MKYFFSLSLLCLLLFSTFNSCAQQDKSKRPSPPALVTQKVGEVTVSIDYSQPSVNGRTVGGDLIATYGEVWRTGANEATVFEISKDVKVEGQTLAAGKYSLYSIPGETEWVIIFNKTWKQWGTQYKQEDDALRVKVKPGKSEAFVEKMTFAINKDGKVMLTWGNVAVGFKVE